jgi:ketosteroid isomerase-like protein
MSKQNVDFHRRHMEAFNARDIEALIAYSDPDVELHSTFAAVGGAVYHGHDGLQRWLRDTEEVWGAEIRGEPQAYFDLGDQTLMFYMLHGRGRHSGAEVAMPVAHMARWRDGLGVYYKSFAHREDALSDLGVSEDELVRIEP